MNESLVVIDFETTGLSPTKGARAIEVAAVKVCDGRIESHYSSLINPGVAIPEMIQDLTGINERMRLKAPTPNHVFNELRRFIGDMPLVAHNAPFDSKFLKFEMERQGLVKSYQFACTLQLSKKLYPRAPSYKLARLLEYVDIEVPMNLHRALADATVTASLWLQILGDLRARRLIADNKHDTIMKYCMKS